MSRDIKDIEADLYKVLSEYCEATKEHPHISFQGMVSELAWDIEHEIEDITDDVC